MKMHNKTCRIYKKYISLQISLFFEIFTIEIKTIILIIIRYACTTSIHSMQAYYGELNKNSVQQSLNTLL